MGRIEKKKKIGLTCAVSGSIEGSGSDRATLALASTAT